MTKLTKKSKIYIVIIIISLLFAAGSLVWQQLSAPILPPAAREAAELSAADDDIYLRHPSMQAFADDIAAALGDIKPDDFATGAAYEKYFNNPQIQKILLKYSKDADFRRQVSQMAADKDSTKNAAQKPL